jgi:hypothetical protein
MDRCGQSKPDETRTPVGKSVSAISENRRRPYHSSNRKLHATKDKQAIDKAAAKKETIAPSETTNQKSEINFDDFAKTRSPCRYDPHCRKWKKQTNC